MSVPAVLAIFGPTASGKSAIAEAVASRIDGELVSADAMQVYEGVPILTNQSPARLVGIWPLEHEASVAEYARLAHDAIDEIVAGGRVAIVVGGTGLYVRAALAELELPPRPDADQRAAFEALYDERGGDAAHALLAEQDPAAAARVHPNDRRRIVRALELAAAGHSLAPENDTLWSQDTRHPTVIVGLDVPSDVLAQRIAQRTKAMFDAGVVEEVQRALEHELSTTAAKIMGLTEVSTLPHDEAVEAITRRTIQFAAYQRKWMRRIPGLVSVRADRPADEVADEIVKVAWPGQRLPVARTGGGAPPADS